MQVMNNDQFNQNEVLIGGSAKTKGFKVSDDPMLMSMLSTGFYANPHRAMVQEVMFNAWDAHRMGNCQDKPIDIYISDNSGFVVRDYGPGIHDDDMEDVYCTYAASTKRDDEDQTGGFGLGSKSPWSYTESFTVTSHHKGVKTMYLMSRVSDDVQGKPGMTQLMSFESDETGLAVSVPVEHNQLRATRTIVEDVLYLSGIKANIHYKDHPLLLIESVKVAPAQYVMDARSENRYKTAIEGNHLYAVYGGVKYKIPNREEYAEEYKFMNLISEISSLYIGFAPHTLSPLPNREGLNMSTNTRENIRVGLELCMERFQTVFDPVIQAYFRTRMDEYKETGIQPHFAMYHAVTQAGMNDFWMNAFKNKMLPLCPINTDPTVWEIALRLMDKVIHQIIEVIGKKRWVSILVQHFIRVYPDARELGYMLLKQEPHDLFKPGSYLRDIHVEKLISDFVMPKQLRRLNDFESKFVKEFPADEGFSRPKVRLERDGEWAAMERHRNAPQGIAMRYMGQSTRRVGSKIVAPVVTFMDPLNIWQAKNGDPVQQMLISNTVVLAKTVSALKETNSGEYSHFASDTIHRPNAYYSKHDFGMVPAYVVHTRKGQYDKALKMFTDLGFNVVEGNEPFRSLATATKPKEIVKQFARINTLKADWCAKLIDIDNPLYDEADGVPLTSPTHFLYVKTSDLQADSSYYYSGGSPHYPTKTLLNHMLAINPNVAMINLSSQIPKLEKDGVLPFENFVKDWYASMGKKVYRLRNIVRVIRVMDEATIPDSMIKDQTIQAAMGIAKIKDDDSAFWDEVGIIRSLSTENFQPLRETAKHLKMSISKVWLDDPQLKRISHAIEATNNLNGSNINKVYCRLSRNKKEQEEYALKLARFIRTM
jgi:hypothetical protein